MTTALWLILSAIIVIGATLIIGYVWGFDSALKWGVTYSEVKEYLDDKRKGKTP